MLSFFKKNKNGSNVPDWASFFDSNEYSAFIQHIEGYFKKRNIPITISDGIISLEESNPFNFGQMGLGNVAQTCKQQDITDYEEVVNSHFDNMIRSQEFEREFQKNITDFDAVKKYIGVRLYGMEYAERIGKDQVLGMELTDDIFATLVFDFPDTIANIQHDQIEPWNKTVEELMQIGEQNIKNNYPQTISKVDLEGLDIWIVTTDHFFAPNIVFELEHKPELLGSKGSLIGLPHRHTAIIYPIENMDVVLATNSIIPMLHWMNEEGPGSLSNKLYWYKNGDFTELPYKISEGKLQFIPPANFVELLNELAK